MWLRMGTSGQALVNMVMNLCSMESVSQLEPSLILDACFTS